MKVVIFDLDQNSRDFNLKNLENYYYELNLKNFPFNLVLDWTGSFKCFGGPSGDFLVKSRKLKIDEKIYPILVAGNFDSENLGGILKSALLKQFEFLMNTFNFSRHDFLFYSELSDKVNTDNDLYKYILEFRKNHKISKKNNNYKLI